jgi:hypothetical protein
MFFNYLIYYLLIGALQLLVMDYATSKVADMVGDESRKFTNWERIIILFLWPIYAWVFWFEFIRSLSNKK